MSEKIWQTFKIKCVKFEQAPWNIKDLIAQNVIFCLPEGYSRCFIISRATIVQSKEVFWTRIKSRKIKHISQMKRKNKKKNERKIKRKNKKNKKKSGRKMKRKNKKNKEKRGRKRKRKNKKIKRNVEEK